MKKLTLIGIAILAFANAEAQTQSANTNQNLSFTTGDNISITFVSTGTNTGSVVTLPFSTVADFANGIESTDQQLEVSSNLGFYVDVKANAANFTYTGSSTTNNTMPVNTLGLMVTANNTGGSIQAPFSSAAYASITSADQTFLSGCSVGTNQAFAIKYKATPGFSYAGGTYTVNVIYTATQL